MAFCAVSLSPVYTVGERLMELTPIYRSVVALDVHHAKSTVCALFEDEHGEVQVQLKEFGGFKRDRRATAERVTSFAPQAVVMESTGIYWKSPYAALEALSIERNAPRWIRMLRKYGYITA